jgi:hypothetical protein
MDVLHRLSTPDLAALAAALRSGRLAPPYSEVAVRRHCGGGVAAMAATLLGELHADGMLPKHAARLIEAVAFTREELPSPSEVTELVWTGPECPGLTNRDTGVVVRELFGSATTDVLIAGFAVYQGHSVFRRLAERMAEIPALRVRMFLDIRRPWGDATPASELVWKFVTHFRTQEWPGERVPDLCYDPRSLEDHKDERSSLHAKCIVVDRRTAFVTSANFTAAAQTRNIEVGALIRSPVFAEELHRHFERLLMSGQLVAVPGRG